MGVTKMEMENPKEDGYYQMEKEKGMFPVLQQLMPQMTEDAWKELYENGGIAMKLRFEKSKAVIEEQRPGKRSRTLAYYFDQPVNYTNPKYGILESRTLMKLGPGQYKMVIKNKSGKTGGYDMKFVEHGIVMTAYVGTLTATCFYRRLCDFEGTWKVQSRVGASGYLDACGLPDSMKSEMMSSVETMKIKRQGGGKLSIKSSSRLMPEENVFSTGEQWEVELPGFGKMTGVFVEHGECFSSCMKIGDKTITVKGKVTGDFIIEECEVDGQPASQMKRILVRQNQLSGEERPWVNGDYILGFPGMGRINHAIVRVEDDLISLHYLKFLDSEEDADHPMSWEEKGDDSLMITFRGETAEAKISEDGKTITGGPGTLAWGDMTWISPEEATVIRNRPKQPADAPTVPYPLKPGKPGKLVIFTGPPGSGKSTTAGAIAKREGWVYYECDGFLFGFNPYISPDESQVDARSENPALIGPGMSARKEAFKRYSFNQLMLDSGETTDRSAKDDYFRLMAEDIKREKARVGGDWVVAFAIPERRDRDVFREVLGDSAIFVALHISFDLVKERLSGRENDEVTMEFLASYHDKYEPAQSDEPKTLAFEILKGVTIEESAQKIVTLLK